MVDGDSSEKKNATLRTNDAQSSRQFGNKTLARGLNALWAVIDAPAGITVPTLAERLGVHRSVAYRMLGTLEDFRLVSQADDGVYRGGAALPALADAYLPSLRATALPVMRQLADRVGATVGLFVLDGDEAIAIEMVKPTTATHHLSFHAGERTPLTAGAAAYALLAAHPPQPNEDVRVQHARELGYGQSHGEVEVGAYAIAAPIPGARPRACLNLLTHIEERAHGAGPTVVAAANHLATQLQ